MNFKKLSPIAIILVALGLASQGFASSNSTDLTSLFNTSDSSCAPQLTAPMTVNSANGYTSINITSVKIYLSTTLNDTSFLYKTSPTAGTLPVGLNSQGVKWCPANITAKFLNAKVPNFVVGQTDACETDVLTQGDGQPAKTVISSMCYQASSRYTILDPNSITINFN